MNDGYDSGSISPSNIFYYNDEKAPVGVLHAPGLVKLNGEPRNIQHSRFPYYEPIKKPITKEDEVVAVAVLLLECLWADGAALRETWKELLLFP